MLLCQPLVDSLVSPVSISSISGLWAATYWFRSWQYLLWSFCYFAIKNFMDARRQERLRLEAETRQKEAELLMLRSQMDPHFLFNALNAIRSTAQMDPIQIKLVEGLSEYLRYSLHYRGSSLVPLGEEINAMRRYLDVEETRYGPGIEVRMDIDPASREVLVPGIFVQPLVENAIKYGRRTSPHPLHLLVSTGLIGEDTLRLTVANSGSWIEPDHHELCQPRSSGAGLDILRRRLQLTYGNRASISVGPQGDRVVAEIEIQHTKRHRPGSAPLPLHNIEVPI
ncbi:MAG: sensor histidine kinase [Verrucomicrobium sp.]